MEVEVEVERVLMTTTHSEHDLRRSIMLRLAVVQRAIELRPVAQPELRSLLEQDDWQVSKDLLQDLPAVIACL